MGASQSKQDSDSWGQSDHIHLPEDVLLKILTFVSVPDLIHRCRLVCALWRDIIDSPTLWIMKCQKMGYITQGCVKHPTDWKHFYYLSSLKKNLLKNPRALEDFQFWVIESNGGDEWAVEDLEADCVTQLGDEKVTKYFVTSFDTCLKSQLIDLRKAGYGKHLMDHVQPDIVIRDWYAARTDCGCQYEVLIQLQSQKKKPLREFKPENVIIPEERGGRWLQMTHTFRNYGPGVRYIYFQHGGKDTKFWAGWYGVRVTNTSITVEPEDLRT